MADNGLKENGLEINKEQVGKELETAKKALLERKDKAFNRAIKGTGAGTVAAVAGNVGKAGTVGKVVIVGGSIAGLGAMISGSKNLIAPERDENGERKGSAWKEVGKIVGGALATYMLAIRGGRAKAMGLS
jgi:hypothetical protein